jgi:hypothetical protein
LTTGWRLSPRFARVLVVLLFLLVSVYAASGQVVAKVYGDAIPYQRTALQFTEHQHPIRGEAPFVYRIGTPWLAALINPPLKWMTAGWPDALVDHWAGLDDVMPFYVINSAASLAIALLLLTYLGYFVRSAGVRVLLVLMWMSEWHTPVRFLYFYPVNVEPLFLVCVLTGLILLEEARSHPPARAFAFVSAVTVIGTLCRESMALLAVAALASRHPIALIKARNWRTLAVVAAPVLAAVAALALTRYLVEPTNDYRAWSEPLMVLRTKPPESWFLAWFFTFGPAAMALMVVSWRPLLALLRGRPEMLTWVIGCGLLAYAGGTDTERILAWSMPVVYVMVGTAIERQWPLLRQMPITATALVVVHLCSARVFWTIPMAGDEAQAMSGLGFDLSSLAALADKFLIIDNYYANLWSNFGSRPLHAVTLVWDVAFVAAVWLALRRMDIQSAGELKPQSQALAGFRV